MLDELKQNDAVDVDDILICPLAAAGDFPF